MSGQLTRRIDGMTVTDTAEAWAEYDANQELQRARNAVSVAYSMVKREGVSVKGRILIGDTVRLLADEATRLKASLVDPSADLGRQRSTLDLLSADVPTEQYPSLPLDKTS